MLLKIIPITAIVLTLIALITTDVWRPYDQSGLFSEAHVTGGTF